MRTNPFTPRLVVDVVCASFTLTFLILFWCYSSPSISFEGKKKKKIACATKSKARLGHITNGNVRTPARWVSVINRTTPTQPPAIHRRRTPTKTKNDGNFPIYTQTGFFWEDKKYWLFERKKKVLKNHLVPDDLIVLFPSYRPIQLLLIY